MQESFQEVTMELCPSNRFASFQEKRQLSTQWNPGLNLKFSNSDFLNVSEIQGHNKKFFKHVFLKSCIEFMSILCHRCWSLISVQIRNRSEKRPN